MWVPEGRITLTPRRQGSPGRPAPALGWQRTPVLPPQGENWAQAGERRQLLRGARGSQSPPPVLHLPQLTPPCLASHLCSEATKDSAQPRSQAQPPPHLPHTHPQFSQSPWLARLGSYALPLNSRQPSPCHPSCHPKWLVQAALRLVPAEAPLALHGQSLITVS